MKLLAHWTDDWNGPASVSGGSYTRYYPPRIVQYRWVLRHGHWTFFQPVEWSRNRPS